MQNRELYTTILFVALVIGCVVFAFLDIITGTTYLPIDDVFAVLCSTMDDATLETIILKMRLPKVVVSMAAGMALSASGLQMQTLFRNPLAGPYPWCEFRCKSWCGTLYPCNSDVGRSIYALVSIIRYNRHGVDRLGFDIVACNVSVA